MDYQESKYHYFFIHNVIGDFFHATLDYFAPYLYERFKYRVVGTYDKAVEFLSKKDQYDRETDMPMLPALVLDPSGEMVTADAIAGGKQLWRYPNLAAKFVKRLYDPVYQDIDVMVNVGFTRLKGTFNLVMLTNSFYENNLNLSQILEKIEKTIPGGIYLKQFSLGSTVREKEKRVQFTLSGYAPNRDRLLEFRENLKNEEGISEVNFSPTSWIEPTEINFTVIFQLSE